LQIINYLTQTNTKVTNKLLTYQVWLRSKNKDQWRYAG